MIQEPPLVVSAALSAVRNNAGDLAIELERYGLQRLPGGRNNSLFIYDAASGRQCIKIYKVDDRNRAEREWRALTLLRQYNFTACPQPLWYRSDESMPMIGMEYIEGVTFSQAAVDQQEINGLSATLSALYSLPIKTKQYPYTAVGRAPERMLKLEAWLTDNSALATSALGRKVRELWVEWQASDDPRILLQPTTPVFSPGDPNLSNYLWNGSVVRCIDFEYAGWSDVAFELADLCEGSHAQRISDAVWATFLTRFDLDSGHLRRFWAARRLCGFYWIYLFGQRGLRNQAVEDKIAHYLQHVRQMMR